MTTGAEATGGEEFDQAEYSASGEVEKLLILHSPMCSGYEYYIAECPGFTNTSVDGQYCVLDEKQAGFRCVEGS